MSYVDNSDKSNPNKNNLLTNENLIIYVLHNSTLFQCSVFTMLWNKIAV